MYMSVFDYTIFYPTNIYNHRSICSLKDKDTLSPKAMRLFTDYSTIIYYPFILQNNISNNTFVLKD